MPIPDRHKQRREYLKKKAVAYGKAAGSDFLLSCLFILTIVFMCLACLCLVSAFFDYFLLVPAVILTLFALLGGFLSYKLDRFVEHAKQIEAAIRYCPPVRPDILPLQEILVRASQEPEQSSVLLRAAESANTPAEQLLRATKVQVPVEK